MKCLQSSVATCDIKKKCGRLSRGTKLWAGLLKCKVFAKFCVLSGQSHESGGELTQYDDDEIQTQLSNFRKCTAEENLRKSDVQGCKIGATEKGHDVFLT